MGNVLTMRFAVLTTIALGSCFVNTEVFANSRSGHSWHSPAQANSFRHHHRKYRPHYIPYYYGGYGYDYGADDAPPPAAAAKPPAEKAAAEVRRGCEPQTYSVPSTDGGESQVTILRC